MCEKKGNIRSLLSKIDLEKAYDRVNWQFLRSTPMEFGFPMHIINLIMSCVFASSLLIVWNGAKLPQFSSTKGLRQGDLVSPYLFVLCMERLGLLINKKVVFGEWHLYMTSILHVELFAMW